MGKYEPLQDHLSNCRGTVGMSFEELDRLIGGLPPSAYKYQAWWANDDATHPHCQAWGDAGYRAEPDLDAAEVVFVPTNA